ncbi:unnamed protein product [Diamesa hyperborea]
MPWWYYEKDDLKNTPSNRDFVDHATEKRYYLCYVYFINNNKVKQYICIILRYRLEGTKFIKECGNLMNLGYATTHTAIVYFHRFYMFHSFKTFPRYVTACSCLFLAGKVEETPKKCRDIIKIANKLLTNPKILSFGEDPKEEVTTMERILLKTIKFDLQVDHPYRYLIEYAKCLKGTGVKLRDDVVQMAWNFVNDSLGTTLCLQWEPEIIAVAMIYLACKISNFNVVDWKGRTSEHQKWWDMFVKDMSKQILDDICHQVLDLYNNKNKIDVPDSPPQLPPSKASPPMKRAKFQIPLSSPVGTLPLNVKTAPSNYIPVKVSSNDIEIPKMISTANLQYAYPSTSYGYISNPAPPQQPPPGISKPPLPPSNCVPSSYQPPLPSSSSSYVQHHPQQQPSYTNNNHNYYPSHQQQKINRNPPNQYASRYHH